MYYFDNDYLKQYIDQGVDLWVYDGYEWHEIADKSDLADPIKGLGYDANGRGSEFVYKQIEQIKVNGTIITMDQLQAQLTGKSPEDNEKSKGGKSTPAPDEKPDEENPEPEKEPELSHHSIYDIGRLLISEWRKHVSTDN